MRWKKIGCILLAVLVLFSDAAVSSASISSIKNQKAQTEKELKNIESKIQNLESEKSALSSEVNSLNDELTDTLLNIEILEGDLEAKEAEIEEAQLAYEEAKETEERQYESMKLRIQYLYESGDGNYIELLLTSKSVADLVNKVDYVSELQEYDRRLLEEYKEAKQEVIELRANLEQEKAELMELEEQMKEEKANLEALIGQKRSEIADFESQLSTAKAKASEYQKKIAQQNAEIKRLQKEAEKAAAEAAKKKNNSSSSSSSNTSSGSSSSGSASTGSGTGAAIAAYGQRFIGNPYVFGGTSLTNGTDCSGFTQAVHANFGISIPRSSSAQATSGKAVSDSEKMPGDVVCYYGHVGIYIGNNQIVHASTPSTGIKISNIYYRSVRCIRRYW